MSLMALGELILDSQAIKLNNFNSRQFTLIEGKHHTISHCHILWSLFSDNATFKCNQPSDMKIIKYRYMYYKTYLLVYQFHFDHSIMIYHHNEMRN